jgi:hypothetical protein
MYASPVSLLLLPPPRRRVNRGKFAPAGRGLPLVMLLRPLVHSCGVGTPARDAPAERGRPPELLLRGGNARRQQFGGYWELRKIG